jgi:hypothetical protein
VHLEVGWLNDERYDFRFQGDEALYRYWDAMQVVEFSLDRARQALEKDLREETEFLDRFDRVYREMDDRFDVRGNALTTLVIAALQNNGKVSKNRRKQFQLTVPDPVFDAIERACAQALET